MLSYASFVASVEDRSTASTITVDCRCFVGTSFGRKLEEGRGVFILDDTSSEQVEDVVLRYKLPSSLPASCVVGNGNLVWFLGTPSVDIEMNARNVVLRSPFSSVVLTEAELKKPPPPPPPPPPSLTPSSSPFSSETCVRLFIAGDKSHVGKSSVCLGLLSALLTHLPASQIAYIKPATQCEGLQLVTLFCESKGIECVPVGPIVYYPGFTRAHLSGSVSVSSLLSLASSEVSRLSVGRVALVVDGVGHPAVGSITKTSNVGAAVDSFNLNRAFFEKEGVQVLGVRK